MSSPSGSFPPIDDRKQESSASANSNAFPPQGNDQKASRRRSSKQKAQDGSATTNQRSPSAMRDSTSEWQLACPLCQRSFSIQTPDLGKTKQCPHCDRKITLPSLELIQKQAEPDSSNVNRQAAFPPKKAESPSDSGIPTLRPTENTQPAAQPSDAIPTLPPSVDAPPITNPSLSDGGATTSSAPAPPPMAPPVAPPIEAVSANSNHARDASLLPEASPPGSLPPLDNANQVAMSQPTSTNDSVTPLPAEAMPDQAIPINASVDDAVPAMIIAQDSTTPAIGHPIPSDTANPQWIDKPSTANELVNQTTVKAESIAPIEESNQKPGEAENLLPPNAIKEASTATDASPPVPHPGDEGGHDNHETATEKRSADDELLPPSGKPTETPVESPNAITAQTQATISAVAPSSEDQILLPDGAGGFMATSSTRVTIDDGEKRVELRKRDRQSRYQFYSASNLIMFGSCVGILVIVLIVLKFVFG